MRRADRLLQLIQILRRHRRPVTGDIMARELEVSLRTVYRDIATLTIEGPPRWIVAFPRTMTTSSDSAGI